MRTFSLFLSPCFLLLALHPATGQAPELPPVFMLGEHETAHMRVDSLIARNLMEAAGYDIATAQAAWLQYLEGMETYADTIDYSLDGLRLFLSLYCDPEGRVLHLGFLPDGNSRNLPWSELRAFFSAYTRNHRFPLTYTYAFKYNSRVNFPLHPRGKPSGGR